MTLVAIIAVGNTNSLLMYTMPGDRRLGLRDRNFVCEHIKRFGSRKTFP
jgi:hypothetical protein